MSMPDNTETPVYRIRRWVDYKYTTPDTLVVDSDLSKFNAGDLKALLSERDAALEERDAADRTNGALAREVQDLKNENARLKDTASRRGSWLSKAKSARGYDDNVSFDKVWSDICVLADRALLAPTEEGEG